MPVSKKQQACVNRYMNNHYDRINLTVPKGDKAIISEHAESKNESVNGFINRAIKNQIVRDSVEAKKEDTK